MIDNIYTVLWPAVLVLLTICIFFALIRAIRGPRVADRIMAINMIGTLATLCLVVLSVCLHESYLLDVGIIYCVLSFLAVIVLSNSHILVQIRKRERAAMKKEEKQRD